MIEFNEHFKKQLQDMAKKLHETARVYTKTGGMTYHVPTEAVANLLDKLAVMEIPFCDLDRFCYFLIKAANKELGNVHFKPYLPSEIAAVENESADFRKETRGDLCHED